MQDFYKTEFEKFVGQIRAYNPALDVGFLERAYNFSYEAHVGQLRKSAEPYFQHCLEVAKILADLRLDQSTIAAGLLHDVVEDTEVPLQEIEQNFGPEVAGLVDGATRIRRLRAISTEEKQAENCRKMLLAVVKDIRVILIKLADRLHNMRTLKYLSPKKQREIAVETRDLYVPLAYRLGIGRIKWELEDLVFKFLHNDIYKELARRVAEKREQREEFIERVAAPIRQALLKNRLSAGIEGRPKSISSIYNKIVKRNIPFDAMYDLFAIRLIVQTVDECYRALEIVHRLFARREDKFRDNIKNPTENGYQTLHTVIVGPENKLVEIQIRTEEMHKTAEEGIAAHWKYKEGKIEDSELDKYLVDFRQWLRQLVEQPQEAVSASNGVLAHLKIKRFQDEIFIYTPKGDLLELPVDSTPVDFAFAIDGGLGLRCLSAKVNGQIVSLDHKLKSGDMVEIIASGNQRPNPDWLKFVRTAQAREAIERAIKEAMLAQSRKLGEEIINHEFKRHHLDKGSVDLETIAGLFSFPDAERLYNAIGAGQVSVHQVIRRIAPDGQTREKEDGEALKKFLRKARGSAKGRRVQSLDNAPIHFAKCCQPAPGDRIVGFVTKGQGVIVHRNDCKKLRGLVENPARQIEANWDGDDDARFLVRLRLLGHDRRNFLCDLGASIAQTGVSIVSMELRAEGSMLHGDMIIEVENLQHLTRLINKIDKINGVISVERLDETGAPVADLASEVSPVWNKAN